MVVLKRQVSFGKFARVRNNTHSIPCQSFRMKRNKYESEYSLESYLLGEYVYAIFECKKQNSNRLNVYCARYWVGDDYRADWFSYTQMPWMKW